MTRGMRVRMVVGIALMAGLLAFGAAGTRATPEDATSPAYVIATLNITDAEKYRRDYGAAFRPILLKYGGRVIAGEEQPEVREGTWPYGRTVVIEFASLDAARAWYDSPDYQAIAKHRWANSNGNLVIIRGLKPAPAIERREPNAPPGREGAGLPPPASASPPASGP